MALFRRNTIFHVEEALPDPDDIKLRFRRRVLFIALVGFLVLLGLPVMRELSAPLRLKDETRKFAERLMETRLLAAKNRTPVVIELSSNQKNWHRKFHAKNSSCEGESTGPYEEWNNNDLHWQFNLQKETGETISGHKLCVHPQLGFILDSTAIGDGKLLVTVKNAADSQETSHLLISNFGAEILSLVD